MSVDILMIASNIVHAQRLEAVLAPLHMQLRRQIGPVFNFTSLFSNPPQLVIVDVTAAGPDDPPLELLAELRRHPSSDGVPRLAWGLDLGQQARVAALRAGAHEVFDQTTPHTYLFARIRNLLRARRASDDLGITQSSTRLLTRSDGDRSFIPMGRTAIISGRRAGMPQALLSLASRLPNAPPPHGLAEDSPSFTPSPLMPAVASPPRL